MGSNPYSQHADVVAALDHCKQQRADPWREPGGDDDPANPQLCIPKSLKVVDKGNAAYWQARGSGGDISDAEIDWMIQQRPLDFSVPQLVLDYGAADAAKIEHAVTSTGMSRDVAGALAWPGVATRWQRFFAWWQCLPQEERPTDAKGALAGFARALGRVRTFRALALDSSGLKRILQEDEIFPSGRLREGIDAAYLRNVVESHGVAKVAVVRLFISHMPKIGGIDPSISLHDDWQTTSVIASGYASAGKRVHLFELSVPAVESLGWTLQEVAERSGPYLGSSYSNHEPWFCFPSPAEPRGTWFDATLQRTERYGLFSIPHLRNRLRRLYVFDSIAKLGQAVAPFVADMAARNKSHPHGQASLSTGTELVKARLLSGRTFDVELVKARLLSGRTFDVDLSSAAGIVDAKRVIAAHLNVQQSQVRILKGGTELVDETMERGEVQVSIVQLPYSYKDKQVKKIMNKGIINGILRQDWRVEYDVSETQSTDQETISEETISEDTAIKLIQDFNFKKCSKVVNFFWHGSSMPVECIYYLPQDAED